MVNKHRSRHRVKNGKKKNNSSGSNWSNDTREQLDLLPGSLAHREYVADKNKSIIQSAYDQFDNKNDIDPDRGELEKDVDIVETDIDPDQLELTRKKRKFHNAYLRANSINHNTNLRRRKRSQVKKARDIIEGGIEKHVSKRDFDDEIYDNGITAEEFIPEAVKDHKHEFEEIYKNTDSDEDLDLTPGGRRMKKYL